MNDVYVAKLGKTVGLKGEIKIHVDSDFPEQFKKGAVFNTNRNIKLTVFSFNETRGVIKFEEFNNIDDAKKLTNQELHTSIDNTKDNCKLKEDQFFWFDIINCEIIEDGLLLGKVKDIHRYPIADYLEIETDAKLIDKKLPNTFLIPYGKEYILNSDIENKKIITKDALAILENS